MRPEARALRLLGQQLRAAEYRFVTVTPETHRRVNARAASQAKDLRDVFGWSRPFARALLPSAMFELLLAANAVYESPAGYRARVRYSTVGELLCVHSAFPTSEPDAVFLGPDTYRFCQLLARWAPRARRAVDIGCGSGAGGLSLAQHAETVVLTDINPRALAYAEVNAALAGLAPTVLHSDLLAAVSGEVDLIVANPPYMRDAAGRVYRDGGGGYGSELSVRLVREALARVSPSGTVIVYTGAPIVAGCDVFYRAVEPYLQVRAARVTYEELDPDVFGDELDQPGYQDVERIAVVGLRVCMTDQS